MKEVIIYTDGACRGNPGPGGWGAWLQSGGNRKELYGGHAETTNNRMELLAAIKGLEALNQRCRVLLYTDGVVEAENADEKAFGIDRLMEEVMQNDRESLEGRVESIIGSVRSWVGGQGFSDDISILAFELNE